MTAGIGPNDSPAFDTLEEMLVASAEAVRPPEQLSVSQAAEKYRYLNNPGSYVGPWSNAKTPYLVEFMDVLQSLDFTGAVFVGPARTGKSDVFFNWLAYTAKCDPADMMMIHMTQNTARDWSQSDLARMLRASKEIGALLRPGKQNDNVHDKKFMSGMGLLIKWPTISELSGKTKPRLWINDYDRGEEIVEKEGIKWDLTKKRAFTYKRFGMCVAESSPGRDVVDPQWSPSTPHEAPPTGDEKTPGGILALYNRGDRRRWYWRCPQCGHAFEPDFDRLVYPNSADIMEAAEQVLMACPADGFPMTPDMQAELNAGARWIKEGQMWLPEGVVGTPRRSDIASFWLKGPAAAFGTWQDLVAKYLTANREYESNGSEESLRGTITLDQGKPYTPKAIAAGRLPESLKQRAENWGGTKEAPVVPLGVRFLIATADVQAGSRAGFVVQVHGIGPGGDVWIVDMFRILKSARRDAQGDVLPIDPAAYAEDWDTLIEQVIERSYPLADDSGRRMSVKMIGCDSGGADGVTTNAYAFWRRLRDDPAQRGHHMRFRLVKGDRLKSVPRAHETFPDSKQRGKDAVARGDVPVLMLNSYLLKDQVSAMLGREVAADAAKVVTALGMVHFPKWADDWLYKQLTAEVRTSKGWDDRAGRRNEAWDLLYYAVGVALYAPVRIETLDWSRPPGWAAEWGSNDLVFGENATPRFQNQLKHENSLEKLRDLLL